MCHLSLGYPHALRTGRAGKHAAVVNAVGQEVELRVGGVKHSQFLRAHKRSASGCRKQPEAVPELTGEFAGTDESFLSVPAMALRAIEFILALLGGSSGHRSGRNHRRSGGSQGNSLGIHTSLVRGDGGVGG